MLGEQDLVAGHRPRDPLDHQGRRTSGDVEHVGVHRIDRGSRDGLGGPGELDRQQLVEGGPGHIPWIDELDDAQRDRFRTYGRSIVAALVSALDSDDPVRRQELLRDAEDACAEYGRVAGREGLASVTTADLFLRFRRPFLAELGALARRREFDAAATSTLIADANAALDGLLLATLRGWEAAALGLSRRGRRPASPTGSPS